MREGKRVHWKPADPPSMMKVLVIILSAAIAWLVFSPHPPHCNGDVLFAAHDPGAQNNIRALHRLALKNGLPTRWLDLRSKGVLLKNNTQLIRREVESQMQGHAACLCVVGFSTNHAEMEVAKVCAARRLKTLAVLEFLPGQRLDGLSPLPSVDWLVGTREAAADLERRHAVLAAHTHVTGSAALETIAQRQCMPPIMAKSRVMRAYRRLIYDLRGSSAQSISWHGPLPRTSDSVVAIFVNAPEAYIGSNGASLAISALLKDACHVAASLAVGGGRAVLIVVRMHPRTSAALEAAVVAATGLCGCAVVDTQRVVDNESLIRAAALVISHGSTTLVEAVVLGIPSVFYKRDFNDAFMEPTMRSVAEEFVPRVSTAAQLRLHMKDALQGPSATNNGLLRATSNNGPVRGGGCNGTAPTRTADGGGVEGHVGALQRQWTVMRSFL